MPRTTFCICCKTSFASNGKRGPVRKCCNACHQTRQSALSKLRKLRNSKQPGAIPKNCMQCGERYLACRQSQKYCSYACAHIASRKRSQCICSNPDCKARFEKLNCDVNQTSNYCCRECFVRHRTHSRCCLECGKQIRRPSQNNPKKDALKYCSRECFFNHRWGRHRPRVNRRNQYACNTSLRVRCKRLSVFHDKSCKREAVLERDSYRCQGCGIQCNRQYMVLKGNRICRKNAELDHIIPLTHPDTPGHTWENCQCLCRSCNMRKSNRIEGTCQMRLALRG